MTPQAKWPKVSWFQYDKLKKLKKKLKEKQ